MHDFRYEEGVVSMFTRSGSLGFIPKSLIMVSGSPWAKATATLNATALDANGNNELDETNIGIPNS